MFYNYQCDLTLFFWCCTCTERIDCFVSCACERSRSHCRHVDGDIASDVRPPAPPFRSLIVSSPRPPQHCLRSVCGIRRFVGADISDNLRARGHFFAVSPNAQHDRSHRTGCAAFRFPVPILEMLPNASTLNYVCLQSFAATCFGQYTRIETFYFIFVCAFSSSN